MQVEEREFSGDRRFGGSRFTDTEPEIGRAVERLSQEWGLRAVPGVAGLAAIPPGGRLRRSKLKWRLPPTPPRPTSLLTRPSSTP